MQEKATTVPANGNGRVKLRAESLCKDFTGDVAVVNDVSFDVYEGEFLSILGPSGCGKTTILRMLIGLLTPTSGRILKDGRDIVQLPSSQRGMGIVFQNYALFENMSVFSNIAYAMKVRHIPDYRERADSIISRMGLDAYRDQKPAELSGGQQQRVAIARTMVLQPDIILFDEPLSALDVSTRLLMRREIKALQKESGVTMIYVTHDQEEAFSLSDRIMVMDRSRIAQLGTPEELLTAPANEYVYKFVSENLKCKVDSLSRFMEML